MKKIKLESLPLDPFSDRYRICPHPNCKEPHMTKNRGRDYCSDECADDHYNMNRRLKKQAEAKNIDYPDVKSDVKPLPEVAQQVNPETTWKDAFKGNLSLLSELQIDKKDGSFFDLHELVDRGLDFSSYSARGKLHNIPEKYDSHFLLIGQFRIYLVDYNKVLIFLQS